ncbi:MAG: PA2779 family protein [Proteobacteria bacterium]|nr:PA2779 family protein [Pseudomonadota bacterium]MBS0608284.1 PA2779 family protein [Pseudomonadota bacterium]
MFKKIVRPGVLAPIVALSLLVNTPLVRAELVGTEAMAAPSQVELEREKIRSFVERANVKERLEAMGVSGLVTADRVAALSEQEVHAMAERIEGMPAGAALSQTDIILILLVAILVVVAI